MPYAMISAWELWNVICYAACVSIARFLFTKYWHSPGANSQMTPSEDQYSDLLLSSNDDAPVSEDAPTHKVRWAMRQPEQRKHSVSRIYA
jgi:hypothetical protein